MKTQKKKSSYTFTKRQKQNSLTVDLFFRTKRLDKTELRATVAEYIKRTYSRRRGSQRQFVDSYSKTETKTLTHALGLNEEQSSDKSNDEERNQPTAESKFEESWQEKRPTKRKRDRDTYLLPPSKKMKFEMKMKNKENVKVETSENAIKSKKI